MRMPLLLCLLITSTMLAACSRTASVQDDLTPCTEPRPEVCTQEYNPVDAEHFDGTRKTYSNACTACSNKDVKGVIRSSGEEIQN